jgi:hypothetical protein
MTISVHDAYCEKIIQRLGVAHELVVAQIDNAFGIGLQADVIAEISKVADCIDDLISIIELQKSEE